MKTTLNSVKNDQKALKPNNENIAERLSINKEEKMGVGRQRCNLYGPCSGRSGRRRWRRWLTARLRRWRDSGTIAARNWHIDYTIDTILSIAEIGNATACDPWSRASLLSREMRLPGPIVQTDPLSADHPDSPFLHHEKTEPAHVIFTLFGNPPNE